MSTRGMYTTPARLGATHVALCIGNCKYEGSPLKNAANDAQDVAALCTKLGFATELVLDATLKDMLAAVRAFEGKLPRGGVGLFFYAGTWEGCSRVATYSPTVSPGHGVEEKGQNYLIPTSYKEEDALDLEYTALKVATVLETLDRAGCNLSLVFLDACRSSTLPARSMSGGTRSLGRGLAKIEAPTGMLISFACAPGSTASDGAGRNGVYTSSLLEHLPREEDVQKVLGYVVSGVKRSTNGSQVPWMSGALARDPGRNNGDIHLVEPQLQSTSATAPSAPAPRTSSVTALDEAAAAGADVAGLTQWLARIGLAKHESSVIPKLVGAGVLNVDDVLKQEESDIAELGLPKFEQQQLVKALKTIAAERQTQEESERKAKEAVDRAEAERIENRIGSKCDC